MAPRVEAIGATAARVEAGATAPQAETPTLTPTPIAPPTPPTEPAAPVALAALAALAAGNRGGSGRPGIRGP